MKDDLDFRFFFSIIDDARGQTLQRLRNALRTICFARGLWFVTVLLGTQVQVHYPISDIWKA
jgi:1-acyl-sn-glycerol-3-phosphate acyltransferase